VRLTLNRAIDQDRWQFAFRAASRLLFVRLVKSATKFRQGDPLEAKWAYPQNIAASI